MYWLFLPLRRYAEFSGRSRRKEYWMYTLGLVILYLLFIVSVVALVGFAFMSGSNSEGLPFNGGALGASMGGALIVLILFVMAALGLFIPSLALSVRRLHDINLSGHWVWIWWGPYIVGGVVQIAAPTIATGLSVIAVLGWLALLIMAMLEGTKGPNRFGDDPKEGGMAEVFA